MALQVNLKKGQKIIINGAVIENAGNRNISLNLHNKASLLRDSEVLGPDDCVTPAARIYYALQCAYIFPEKYEEHLRFFYLHLKEYIKAAPSCAPIVNDIEQEIDDANLYGALKKTQELINHEARVLENVRQPEPAEPSEVPKST